MMTPFQQRALARRARLYVQVGSNPNSVTQAAERCGISRAYYYQLVHELEQFEESNPDENRVEYIAVSDAAGVMARQYLGADATEAQVNGAAIRLMMTDDFYAMLAEQSKEQDSLLM